MITLDENTKKRIDKYFDEITPEELYRRSVELYGFKEVKEYNNMGFEKIQPSSYSYSVDNSIDVNSKDTSPFAA